jgi:hypothetical protein
VISIRIGVNDLTAEDARTVRRGSASRAQEVEIAAQQHPRLPAAVALHSYHSQNVLDM